MTKQNMTLKSFTAFLVSLAMVLTLSVSLFASAAAETITEAVVVTQTIEPGTVPAQTSYTYVLTPKETDNPMPEGTKNGTYTLPTINGATKDSTAPTFTLAIDKSRPGVYEYILEKLETTPEGDTLSPEKHIFGYKVDLNENGELVVIPYICQSGSPVFSDPDENGYPTKLTLVNHIVGSPTTKTTTTTTRTSATAKESTRPGATTQKGTQGTTSRASRVNTGDESNLILWVAVLGVAALGLIILILLRRRRDDDDEYNS